ncbi:MAG: M23 family metallopeptidase [Coriobacteriia bacterium]|nr:M23 family metallopeptidase [Coriobacteriia bacterium]
MALLTPRKPRRRGVRQGPELRLGPSHDTGMTLGGGGPRIRRRRNVSRDPWLVPLLIVVGAFLLAAVALSRPAATRTAHLQAVAISQPVVDVTVAKLVRQTPAFATCGTLRLRLPVPVESVTAVAFHQASINHAITMTSLVPEISTGAAARLATQKRTATATVAPAVPATATVTTATATPSDVWDGRAIRLWRSGRSGSPDTAVDVGAKAGTPVFAPVDGTVVYVRQYKLYNKYADYEVHITPTGTDDVDVVLIHISDVCVSPGDEVKAGLTRLASVRRLSNLTALQLGRYTTDGGNHTHVQVNRLPRPGSIWVSLPSGAAIVPFAALAASSTPTATPAP